MSTLTRKIDRSNFSIEFHLLGRIDFDACLALQQRLVYESSSRADGRIDVLLCEHPDLITVGRSGSRAHIRLSDDELWRRQLSIRWVTRRGPCVLHSPGQLAIYPIVPLHWHGLTVLEFTSLFQSALVETLRLLKVQTETCTERFGISGRTGQLASFGVSVRQGVTMHGAFLNVGPQMKHYGYIDVIPRHELEPRQKSTMSCLLAERRRPVTMPEVRATLIAEVARSFDCERYHLHTGHPFLLQEASCA